MKKDELAIIIIGIFLVIFMFIVNPILCVTAINTENTYKPTIIATGKIVPVIDCFNDFERFELIDNNTKIDLSRFISYERNISPDGFIYKLNSEGKKFYIKDYDKNATYYLYRTTGQCLWWIFDHIYIDTGCK